MKLLPRCLFLALIAATISCKAQVHINDRSDDTATGETSTESESETITSDTTQNSATATVSEGTVGTPTFSLSDGTYGSTQTVTITSETSGAKIYYTTDGTAPTTSSTFYTGPITVSSTQTLRAIAVKDLWDDSTVGSTSHIILPTFALGQTSTTAQVGAIRGMADPRSQVIVSGKLFVVDRSNHRVLVWNSVPTSFGQTPDFALGQPELVSNTKNNGGISASSLSSPYSVFSDGTRLFVTDAGNHRILVWNSLPTSFAHAADFALAQPDLVSNIKNGGNVFYVTSATSLSYPREGYSNGTKLFVVDQGNHRVVVWNSLTGVSGQAADYALGQPDLDSNDVDANEWPTITGVSMNTPQGLYSDGTKLFVVDVFNFRVHVWNTLPTTSGEMCDFMLGQTGFSGDSSGGGSAKMTTPEGIYGDGTSLFVGDSQNNRILVWNTFPTGHGEAADFAIGQPNLTTYTSNTGGVSGSSMGRHSGIFIDGTKLYVAESGNNRILVWNTLPTTFGDAADFAIGQPTISSNTKNNGDLSAATFSRADGVYSDGTKLYVADAGNNRVLVWNTLPTNSGQAADFALGQPDLISNLANNGGISTSTMNSPKGVYSDGTRLFVVDEFNNRVLVWNTLPTSSGQAANFALGQPNSTSSAYNSGGVTASTMYRPTKVYSLGSQLFVADHYNSRVLVWNTMPTGYGEPANFALGQPDLLSKTSNNGGISGSTMGFPSGVFSDGTKLFVSDFYNNRVLVWNNIPTGSGEAADFVLGQTDLVTKTAGSTISTLNYPSGVYIDGTRLFVSDSNNDRILVWNSLTASNGQAADYVIDQPDLVSNTVEIGGLSASTLSAPSSIFGDGTNLYIIDAGHDRVLVSLMP